MTFAPSAFASCSDATPTPDETPLISSHSPAFSRPCSTSMSKDTRKVSGMLAASSHERAGGIAIVSATSKSAYSENAPAQRPMTRSPGLKRGDLRPDGDDFAGAFAADRLPASRPCRAGHGPPRTRHG